MTVFGCTGVLTAAGPRTMCSMLRAFAGSAIGAYELGPIYNEQQLCTLKARCPRERRVARIVWVSDPRPGRWPAGNARAHVRSRRCYGFWEWRWAIRRPESINLPPSARGQRRGAPPPCSRPPQRFPRRTGPTPSIVGVPAAGKYLKPSTGILFPIIPPGDQLVSGCIAGRFVLTRPHCLQSEQAFMYIFIQESKGMCRRSLHICSKLSNVNFLFRHAAAVPEGESNLGRAIVAYRKWRRGQYLRGATGSLRRQAWSY